MKRILLALFLSVATVCACAFCLTACNTSEPKAPTPSDVYTVHGTDYIGVYYWYIPYSDYDIEFNLDGGEWVSPSTPEELDGRSCSPVWKDLTPGTTYTLYARCKGQVNGKTIVGDSVSEEITLGKASSNDTPDVTLTMTDGKTVKINGFTQEMQASYSIVTPSFETSGSDGYIDSDTFTFENNGRITVNVRFKDNASTVYNSYASLNAVATDFGGGTGSKEDPFLITTLEQLIATGEADYHYMPHDSYFRLENDIDCSALTEPIKNGASYFNILDGNGKRLTNVNVSATQGSSSSLDVGVFACISGVENLTVENARIAVTYVDNDVSAHIGIIAGQTSGYVRNCKVSGTIEVSVLSEGENFAERMYPAYINAGGISGWVMGNMENCESDVEIIFPDATVRGLSYYPYIGGLAGTCSGNVALSSANLKVSGANLAAAVSNGGTFGGLFGNGASGGTVENCFATARLNIKFAVPYSRAEKEVGYIGGLVGNSSAAIKNSYAYSVINVEAESVYAVNAGGLSGGKVAALENCFADLTLEITANEPKTDALSVSSEDGATVRNCYYTGGTPSVQEGATAVERINLRSKEWQIENLGWDEEVWQFHDYNTESGIYYPTLK